MKTKRYRGSSWILFALCFIAYTFSYFGRYNFSACLASMEAAGVLDKSFGGLISSAYLITYGAGQFINGRIGVKVRPEIMVGTGLFGAGLANILMGAASGRFLFLILWAANGFFNSMLWSPIIRIFTDRLNEKERAHAGADISLTIPIGMTVSYLISSFMLSQTGWREVFFTCGSLLVLGGSVWIIGNLKLRGTKPIADSAPKPANKTKSPSLTLSLFFGTGIALIAIVALFNGSLKDAVLSWAPSYLQDTYGFSDSAASLVSTLLPLFSVAGPYAAVFIDERLFKNEVATCGVFFCAAALCFITVMMLNGALPMLAVVLLASSMCFMWGVNTMILTFVPYRFGGTGLSSAVSGTLNCAAYISASSCTVLYGSMTEASGWSSTVLVWTAFAACGSAVCFLLSLPWKKKRPEISQG